MKNGMDYKSKGSKHDNPKDKKPVSVNEAKKGFGADKKSTQKAKLRHEAQQMQD